MERIPVVLLLAVALYAATFGLVCTPIVTLPPSPVSTPAPVNEGAKESGPSLANVEDIMMDPSAKLHINKCGLDKGGCDHKCINRAGSYHCACKEGYTLQSDKKTCLADGADNVINPCAVNNGGCQQLCTVSGDSRMCSCKSGFHAGPSHNPSRNGFSASYRTITS